MPMIRVSLQAGKPVSYRRAILDSLYTALREALGVPDGDNFMTIAEHDPENFRTGGAFGIERSADTVYIAIDLFNTRSTEQKAALFARIAELLTASPGLRPEDVFITIHDLPKENWSVGMGGMQFAPGKPSHG
ncbi:MAG: tautomerase family protein [Notoacmeibacter sp.]|nr:tautomerase family protein [Notoacmeibacter sp.]